MLFLFLPRNIRIIWQLLEGEEEVMGGKEELCPIITPGPMKQE